MPRNSWKELQEELLAREDETFLLWLDRILTSKAYIVFNIGFVVFFRTLDTFLDVLSATKFYVYGEYWYGSLILLFIFPTAIMQYALVKYVQGWHSRAWPYLVPCSLHHIQREILDLWFLVKLPESALKGGLHKNVACRVMNTTLAGIECAFESFPQAIIQVTAYFFAASGGSWVNYLSISFSLVMVALGVFNGIRSLLRRDVSGTRYVLDPRQSNVSLTDGTTILFDSMNVCDETMTALAWLVSTDEELVHLSFNRTNATDEQIIAVTRNCPKMLSLQLNKTKITDDATKVAAIICARLQKLWLQETAVTDDSIFVVARFCPNLRSLNVEKTGITDASVIAIAKACPLIDALYLGECSITDEGLSAVARHCPLLYYLAIGKTNIGDKSMTLIAQYCPKLTKLGFTGTHVTNATAKALGQYNVCLENLVTRSTKIDDEGIQAVVNSINTIKLVWVCSTSVTDAALNVIAQRCTTLDSFKCGKTNVSEDAIVAVARASGRTLQTLDLSSTCISDTGIKQIAEACVNLVVVMLNECSITNDSVVALARRCPGLKQLDLDHTQITHYALERAVVELPKLEKFNCKGVGITDAAATVARAHNPRMELIWTVIDDL